MIIDPENANVASLRATAVERWSYTAEGGIPWPKLCLKRVVEEYFRNEGETWNTAHIDNVPVVAIAEDRSSWMHSLHMVDDLIADDVSISTAGDDAFTMSELEAARREYELLKAHGLGRNMTWEDYLVQAGVRTNQLDEPHRPELIRHVREWTYPTNTINPASGAPSSAVSYAVAERADKARFFKEPGFIFGVTCCRPKVYLKNQVGLSVGFHDHSALWLPPMLQDDAWSALTTHIQASDSGPISSITDAEGYGWDVRDLLLYGEQYMNFDPTSATGRNLVNLPAATTQREYVAEADINGMFVSETADQIRQDGVVQLTIKTRQKDTTPSSMGQLA